MANRVSGTTMQFVSPARAQAPMKIQTARDDADSTTDIVTTRTTAYGAVSAQSPTSTRPASFVDSSSSSEDRFVVGTGHFARHRLSFFGTDANNETFNGIIYGIEEWSGVGSTESVLYVYKPICEFTGILGTLVGVANEDNGLTASVRFADTIAVVTDYSDLSTCRVRNSGNNGVATLEIDKAAYIAYEIQLVNDTSATIGVAVGGL